LLWTTRGGQIQDRSRVSRCAQAHRVTHCGLDHRDEEQPHVRTLNSIDCMHLAGMGGGMHKFSILVLLSLAACAREADVPAATRTTVVISGPEEELKNPIDIRSFAVVPESLRPGQAAVVTIELAVPRPSQQLSVNWYGPDGWLVAYDVREAAEARLSLPAPIRAFGEPGRYRVVLRSARRTLAESAVVVRGP
jgi:hypothetical protein